jgi:serine/threonine-protein kinase
LLRPTQGTVVLARYVLEQELARGGMSTLWAARDHNLGRPVAVKLLAGAWPSLEARNRFEREARAVAQLQSPHIVQIYDFGVEQQCPVIVMERLYGEDLRARLKRQRRLPLPSVARLVAQAAKGLSEAHAAGIVHRDVKPGNIFFARSRHDELVKLLDFGVAKAASGSVIDESGGTGLTGLVGTPHFMSPEQASGRADVDHRSDLWALGVIVYYALTGQLPYGGSTVVEVIQKICREPFAMPSSIVPELLPDVDAFVARALAHDPGDRFATARELCEAFQRIVPPSASMPEAPVARPRHDTDTQTLEHELPAPGASPSEPPSLPTHPSGTLGSALMEPREPTSPLPRVALWCALSLVVAAIGVAAAFVVWSPEPDPTPVRAAAPGPSEEAPEEDEPAEEPSATASAVRSKPPPRRPPPRSTAAPPAAKAPPPKNVDYDSRF